MNKRCAMWLLLNNLNFFTSISISFSTVCRKSKQLKIQAVLRYVSVSSSSVEVECIDLTQLTQSLLSSLPRCAMCERVNSIPFNKITQISFLFLLSPLILHNFFYRWNGIACFCTLWCVLMWLCWESSPSAANENENESAKKPDFQHWNTRKIVKWTLKASFSLLSCTSVRWWWNILFRGWFMLSKCLHGKSRNSCFRFGGWFFLFGFLETSFLRIGRVNKL